MKKYTIKRIADIFYVRSRHLLRKLFQMQYPLLNPIARNWQYGGEEVLGVVYMLHRVSDFELEKLYPTEDLKVTPCFLQLIIDKYRKQHFDFLSLDEVYDVITHKRKLNRPFISFTLDDGYLDNYINAYPIFKKNDIPFTVYITTNFIDRKAVLWWYVIEDLILSQPEIRLSDGTIYSCSTPLDQWNTFRLLREKILSLEKVSFVESLNKLFDNYSLDWYYPVNKLSMSWEQVKNISKDKLCTIGGHTVTHPVLNKLSEKEFTEEVKTGIDKLTQITGKEIKHFAYPYGTLNEVGEREFRLIRNFCFKTVFCSDGGCITMQTRDLSCLPRVMLKQDIF